MSIDLKAERMTLGEVAQLCGVHISSIWRWTLKGVRGVKLESFAIGQKRYVTAEELERFLTAQNPEAQSKSPPSKSSRQRADAAARKLDAIGIGAKG